MSHGTVEQLLRTRLGLDPDTAGPGLVRRAVRSRMIALGMPEAELERYTALIDRSAPEFQALVEEVVTAESWFFRDEVPFTLLTQHCSRLLLADPFREPFRVLSMPCANGEEPYSAVMALLDAGVEPGRFQVDAVDVSRDALKLARRAVYSDNAFRSRDLGFRDRYFSPVPEGYALDARVKGRARFHQANLVDADLLAMEGPFDAIFCRNLLIYLDPPSRERVLGNVDRLLGPSGLIFVGHAEQLGLLGDRFRPVLPRGSFAFERAEGLDRQTVGLPGLLSLPKPLPAREPKQLPKPAPATPRPLKRENPSPGPGSPVSGRPPDVQPPVAKVGASALLDEASRLAGEGRHDEASRLCEEDLRSRGPTADAYVLVGMISQAAGDRAKAESFFEKAVYLDVLHEDALLALALLAKRRGDEAAAANYQRRAKRAHQENQRR